MKYKLSRITILTAAKMYAAFMSSAVLLFMIPMGLIMALTGDLSVVAIIGFLLGASILYGLMGFIVGAIIAFIYNVISKKIGGLEFEISKDESVE